MVSKKRARIAAALVVVSGGVGALPQWRSSYATVFFALSAGLAVTALLVLLVGRHVRRWTLLVAGVTSFAMAATLTASSASTGSTATRDTVVPQSFARFTPTLSTNVVDVTAPTTMSSKIDTTRATQLVQEAANRQAASRELAGTEKATVLDAASRSGYTLKSGLDAAYATGHVYSIGTGVLATVQLVGTNAPELSRVAYLYDGGKLTVIESVTRLMDADHVSLKAWNNGALTKNVIISRPGSSSKVENVGLDWNRLNQCLSSAGVAWWVLAALSALCGVACLTVVLCAECIAAEVGWLGGMGAGCVYASWT